jgi:formylglycine-generating enzyme required for sulfatase activity
MRLRFTVLFGLLLTLMATVSQGELKMQVHQGGQAEEFVVSAIDSLTFYEDETVTPGFVSLPAGTFVMGSPEDEPERWDGETQHTVTLTTPFEMFATEVTNRQYADLAQWAYDLGYCTATSSSLRDALDGSTEELLDLDSGYCEIQFDEETESFYLQESPCSNAQNAYPDGYDPSNHPVFEMTWYGSVAYCDWLNLQAGLTRAYDHDTWTCNGNDPYYAEGYRLPTEAEWEYACRAGTQTPFNTGECLDVETEANYTGTHPYLGCPGGPNVDWTVPVGSYPANTFGLYDMHGNLWEWCNDWFDYGYSGSDETDPVGPVAGSYRVIRGGSWCSSAHYCRSARRISDYPIDSDPDVGFRPVRSLN